MHEIKIRQADYTEPSVRALLVDVIAELSERYGGSGDDTPIADEDFAPPNGAFYVADDGERLVACAAWRRHGDDAELKRMAQKTMEMQQKEVSELQSWLDRHGGRAARP